MLSEALAFPRNDDDWFKTVGIGGLLVLGGAIFFIPIFPVYGYLLQTVRAGALKERRPPRFGDWERLFVDGAKMFAVMFILVAIPSFIFFIVLLIGLGVGIAAFAGSGGGGAALGAVGLVVGLLVLAAFLVIMFTGYVFPVALVRLALEDDFSAAFDFGTMKQAAFNWNFFVAWLVALGVGLTLGLVATILTFLIVGIFLTFFVQVVVFYILGWGVGEALELDPSNYPPGPGAAPAGGGPGGPGPHSGPGGHGQTGYQQGGGPQQGGYQQQGGRGGYQQGNQGGYQQHGGQSGGPQQSGQQQRGGYGDPQQGSRGEYQQQSGRGGYQHQGGQDDYQQGGHSGPQHGSGQGGPQQGSPDQSGDEPAGTEEHGQERYQEDYREFTDDDEEDGDNERP